MITGNSIAIFVKGVVLAALVWTPFWLAAGGKTIKGAEAFAER